MTAATVVRFDTTNRGGIAKDFRAGLDFKVTYIKDGEEITFLHNTATVSVLAKLNELGIAFSDAHIEKLR